MNIDLFMNFGNFCIDNFYDVFNFRKLTSISLDDTLNVSNGWSFIEIWAVQSSLTVRFVKFYLILNFLADFAADIIAASQGQLWILDFHSWTDLIVRRRALVLNSAGATSLDDRWLQRSPILV